MTAPKGKIVVFGIMFWYPLAGVTYQLLHYLLGLRKLGYDAYYVEDTWREVYDVAAGDFVPDLGNNLPTIVPVLERFGFAGKWAHRDTEGKLSGMSEADLASLYRDCDASLNVTGAQEVRDEHRCIRKRIFIESDPFAMQVKVAKAHPGTLEFLDSHHLHFSFGELLGKPGCSVPVSRYHWQPTRQPVDLELWANPLPPDPPNPTHSRWTTITTWKNNHTPVEWQGDLYYWTKDREFRSFLDVPLRRPGSRFELATGVDDATAAELRRNGWLLSDAHEASKNIDVYRDYIQRSRGEFTVARDQYVRPRTGWFSDRTVAYLAAGRPVITQETGFSDAVTSGRGLFGFSTMDDILAAVDAVESDYPGHCRAAREVADAYFDNRKVLSSLLERAGVA